MYKFPGIAKSSDASSTTQYKLYWVHYCVSTSHSLWSVYRCDLFCYNPITRGALVRRQASLSLSCVFPSLLTRKA